MTGPRILMVIESQYPSEGGGGGAEFQVTTLSSHLIKNGWMVTVVAPNTKGGSTRDSEILGGIPVRRISYPKVRLIGGVVLLSRLVVFLIKERRDYSVIHVHIAHHMAAVAALTGRVLRKRVVIKLTGWMELEHGILKSTPFGLKNWLMRKSMSLAHQFQATSTCLANNLALKGVSKEKIVLIPNAVDTNKFQPGPTNGQRSVVKKDEIRTGIYVGRFVDEKGIEDFLTAWFSVIAPDAPMRLIMIGDGVLRDRVMTLVKYNQRSGQILFEGPVGNVEEWLRKADFGILPSYFEGLSNTLLEYMASGLPVLGSVVSGNEDLIVPGVTGWLFEAGNQQEIREALQKLIASEPGDLASMGIAARAKVADYAKIDTVVERLVAAYGYPGLQLTGGEI